MAVTIFEPYTTTFGKRNKLEHHRNPSGTINKAKWLLSKSERNHNKLNSLVCSIEAGFPLSFERKSWQAAFYMATFCIVNKIEKVEDHFNQKNYKNYQSRKSVSSKNIPWFDCLLGGNKMKDIEIVVFNDKSWVRLVEYQKLDEELKNEKYLNAEIKKRLIEVEYDCEEFNHEYCDPNCNGKRKETIDLLQLISDGLNETLLKQKDEEIKQLAKRICELQSDLSKAKSQIEKMKCCENCIDYTKLYETEGCDCENLDNWRMNNEKKN